MRFGNVALVGRTNVGKSTFLNAALGEPLAIISPLPQTTRDTLLGVVHLEDAQIAFIDTPGLHRPRHELGRRMNAAAVDAARSADVVLVMTDTHVVRPEAETPLPAGARTRDTTGIPPGDREAIGQVPSDLPTVLVINKVDKLKQKPQLLATIEAFAALRPFAAIIPASMRRPADVERVLREVARHLPEGPAGYDADTLTNRPAHFFVREYIREQVMLQTGREVPHAVAVSVDSVSDRGDLVVIQATVHVEKVGQRKIIVGAGGQQLKAIGQAARERIETMLEKRVFLELFVRVTPRWRNMPRQLAELGYEPAAEDGGPAHPEPVPPGGD